MRHVLTGCSFSRMVCGRATIGGRGSRVCVTYSHFSNNKSYIICPIPIYKFQDINYLAILHE
jgi:hypothetical protein